MCYGRKIKQHCSINRKVPPHADRGNWVETNDWSLLHVAFFLFCHSLLSIKKGTILTTFLTTPLTTNPPPLPLVNIWQMIVWICGTYVVNQSMPGSLSKELAIHSPLLVSQQKNMFNQVEIIKGMEGPSQSFPLA